MAQSLLQSGTVHLTVDQVATFIESLEKQLRTHSYDPMALETGDLAYPQLTNPELSDPQEASDI